MSPQFVDFDGDGRLDIVAGTFDGSPHVAIGSAEGWKQPEQILDASGARIVLNQFWNFDTKKWDETKRCDLEGAVHGQGTSAAAFDWDGDGDLDLLLGDHETGRIYRRMNEGTSKAPKFAAKNVVLRVGKNVIDVPGTVSTLRVLDWNKDGLMDVLACGMGNDEDGGGGVFVYVNAGKKDAPVFDEARTLIAPGSHAGLHAPVRPDSSYYADAADCDGDGDLDLIVGGYSNWRAEEPVLTDVQKKRVGVLKQELADVESSRQALYEKMDKAVGGANDAEADKRREDFLTVHKGEFAALSKRHQAIEKELDPLIGGGKHAGFVWLYENTSNAAVTSAK